MKEVFQSYDHYLDWIRENSTEHEEMILDQGLAVEVKEIRPLTRSEFYQKELEGFILIPELK